MSLSSTRAREDILNRLRHATGAKKRKPEDISLLLERLEKPTRGIIPARSRLQGRALVEQFIKMAEAVQTTFICLDEIAALPEAVLTYLAAYNLPFRVKMADHELLTDIDWKAHPALEMVTGASAGDDPVSLSVAFAGVAETGSLMLLSGPDGPTTLNFLPESHLVVLRRSDILGSYEEGWDRLRERQKQTGGYLTRTVNFITGPSRTGDIEQKILLGAHGPYRLHIFILEDS